jgi:hypothetical protein
MIQESVKYKELFNITLVVKNDPYDDDGFDSGTYTVDFQNSIYIIRGDSMIIETVEDDSIIGKVFNLKIIESYKIEQYKFL